MPSRQPRTLFAAVPAFASLLVLAACGGGDSGGSTNGDGGEGDPAIAELEPQTYRVQTVYGPDYSASVAADNFAAKVNVETDERLEFELHYSSSLAGVPEQGEAIKSGLLDMAVLYPVYSPDAYPISNTYSDLAFQGPQTPLVGTLVEFAASMEAGFHPAHMEELRQVGGIEPLMPMAGIIPNYHLLCTDTAVTDLSSASGVRVRVSGEGYAGEVSALGMQPVQLAGPEIYEGLERGAVDCNLGSLGLNYSQGLVDLVDHYTVDSKTPFLGWNSGAWGFASDRWEELPVEAQRLIWDAAESEYVRSQLTGHLNEVIEEFQYGIERGVEYHELDEEARSALSDHREQVSQQARAEVDEALGSDYDGGEFVGEFVALYDKWTGIVEDLGYSDEDHQTWDEFAKAYPDGPPDLAPFFDALKEEVFDPNRP